jgi:hypothetical protein
MPGLLRCFFEEINTWPGSERHPTPVEAVDQRCADGLHERSEGDVEASRQVSAIDPFLKILAVKPGRTIFRLHEPAGSVDPEEVQVVLDATAHEPALGIEAVGVQPHRGAGVGAQQGAARPVRPGVAAVDVAGHANVQALFNEASGFRPMRVKSRRE